MNGYFTKILSKDHQQYTSLIITPTAHVFTVKFRYLALQFHVLNVFNT